MSPHAPAERMLGFTLVELVIVIMILALVSAIAGPRFFDRTAFEERGFYDEVVTAARYAQRLAVATGCDVQFNITGNSYSLNQRATNCTTGAFTRGVSNPATGATTFTGASSSGIAASMTTNPVVFDALGRATDLTDRTVTVGGRTFQIVGATGFVQAP